MANLSKIKRERMLEYLKKLKEQNNDDESIRAITEIENALNEKKYGLVWEEHSEQVDEMLEHNIPIFIENKNRKIVADKNQPFNFLLEGDNLHSLKLLVKTHKGMIDVIYIDPPYNTKNKEFVYDDTRIGLEDGYRHSKWISFMEKRLYLAKDLLTKDGAIFINIDENEVHQLKMLCDDIFGENNFVGEFIWKARSGKGGTTSLISVEHESILCYSKNRFEANFYMDIRISDIEKTEQLRQWGQAVLREDRPTMFFPIFYNEEKGLWKLPAKDEISGLYSSTESKFDDEYLEKLIQSYEKENWISYLPKIDSNYGRWRRGYDSIQDLIDNGLIISENESVKRIIPGGNTTKSAVSSILAESIGTSATGTKEIKELFENRKVFDTTKPISLVVYLVNLSVFNKSNAAILDFFAGSGTTGHAVAQLNKEDGGNRKYILCTNNENNICEEVTYQRLKNIQNDLPHNLKYYKTDFIEKFSQDESISEKMLSHIRELIELEHHLEIDDKHTIILENEDDIDNVINRIEEGGKLFIVSGIFLSRSEQRTLEKKRVEIIEIPEYYFREELREVGEL